MRRIAALALAASGCFSKPPFSGGNGDGGPRDSTELIDGRAVDAPGDAPSETGNDADAEAGMGPPPCPAIVDTFDVATQGPCAAWGMRYQGQAFANNGELQLSLTAQAGGTPAGCATLNPMPFNRGLWAQITPESLTNDHIYFDLWVGTAVASIHLIPTSGGLMKVITAPGTNNAVPVPIDPVWRWWKFQRQGTTNVLDIFRSTDGVTWSIDTANINFGPNSLAAVNFSLRAETTSATFHLSARIDNLNSPCTP